MARKSNKTAHVLNLLSGHDAQSAADDTPDTRTSAEDKTPGAGSSADVKTTAQDASAPADSRSTASSAPSQNISVIDTTGEDPVADLIQQNLSAQFDGDGKETSSEDPEDKAVSAEISDNIEAADSLSSAIMEDGSDLPLSTDVEEQNSESSSTYTIATEDRTDVTVPTPDPLPEPTPISVPSPDPVSSVSVPDPESVPGPGPTTVPKKTAEPEPEPEPEPDFIYLNVMEAIVRDKIIYYMRQFDVCTCDRCVADTIALAMNGLSPKYIVTSPAAVDPLIGFYTNKLISDITVEATKACITVKETPRH